MRLRFAPFLRSAQAMTLALLLALTSVTMAVARGQVMRDGTVVLCSGAVISAGAPDASGTPAGPAHICPDMALGLLVALDLALPQAACPQTRARLLADRPAQRSRGRALPVARARAPPLAA
jgi:hypothetical protein